MQYLLLYKGKAAGCLQCMPVTEYAVAYSVAEKWQEAHHPHSHTVRAKFVFFQTARDGRLLPSSFSTLLVFREAFLQPPPCPLGLLPFSYDTIAWSVRAWPGSSGIKRFHAHQTAHVLISIVIHTNLNVHNPTVSSQTKPTIPSGY
jgi:hypothetical protein